MSIFASKLMICIFLSTPSARRATCQRRKRWHYRYYFYPRPPRGGRLARPLHPGVPQRFLSTPSARRATHWLNCRARYLLFLSTPSARRATIQPLANIGLIVISIHALREEGDANHVSASLSYAYFYPRPPRGGRLGDVDAYLTPMIISIHALREEGDPFCGGNIKRANIFLSTPSARRATVAQLSM